MTERQYYYQVNGCEALNARTPTCVCWHDEGTGPLADAPESCKSWRTKPTMADTLAAQQAVMQQALDALGKARFDSLNMSLADMRELSAAAESLRAALSATQEKPDASDH